MKKWMILLLLLISPLLFGVKTGECLFNLYPGGLNLRKEPSKESKLLATLEYGEKIEVIEPTQQKFETDNLRGYWVKIRYKKKEGYLFDGYLTSLPVPDAKHIKGEGEVNFKEYNDKNLSGKGKVSISEKKGSMRQVLWIPEVKKLEEGFLIARILTYRVFGGYKFPVAWKNYVNSNNEKITQGHNKSSVFIKIEYLESSAKANLQVRLLSGGVEICYSTEYK